MSARGALWDAWVGAATLNEDVHVHVWRDTVDVQLAFDRRCTDADRISSLAGVGRGITFPDALGHEVAPEWAVAATDYGPHRTTDAAGNVQLAATRGDVRWKVWVPVTGPVSDAVLDGLRDTLGAGSHGSEYSAVLLDSGHAQANGEGVTDDEAN
jgi:hypothetical protein